MPQSANPPTRRKTTVLLALLAVIWVSIGLIWWARRPLDLEQEARTLHRAMMTADGETLFRYAFPEEIEANRLTPEKLETLYRTIVLPRLANLSKRGNLVSQNNGLQGVAELQFETRFGRSFGFTASTFPVFGEARSPVLKAVFGAWILSYFSDHDVPFNLQTRNLAAIEGVKADLRRLKEIGIVALSDVDVMQGKITLIPINTLQRDYERWNLVEGSRTGIR